MIRVKGKKLKNINTRKVSALLTMMGDDSLTGRNRMVGSAEKNMS
jgi:hypothetical protein